MQYKWQGFGGHISHPQRSSTAFCIRYPIPSRIWNFKLSSHSVTFISIIVTFSTAGNEFRLDSTLRVYERVSLIFFSFDGFSYHELWIIFLFHGAMNVNIWTQRSTGYFSFSWIFNWLLNKLFNCLFSLGH